MKVYLLSIGDELLMGQVVNTNASWMAQQLTQLGMEVVEISTVGDEHAAIVEGLEKGVETADLVILTGGLGPTRDDITKKALADFYGTGFVFHQPTYDRMVAYFKKSGYPITEAHRAQSFMPQNATLMTNGMGSAPGMWFEEDNKIVVSLPGVPYEMQWLMTQEVLPRLMKLITNDVLVHRSVLCTGIGETRIADFIEPWLEDLPSNMDIAYLPYLGGVRLRLTGRGQQEQILKKEIDQKTQELAALLDKYVLGYDDDTPAVAIGRFLKTKKLTLSTAESCTGGYLAHLITAVPGCSEYYKGSVVAYAYEAKERQLGVQSKTLLTHGAVSEETVIEMAKGVIKALNTDIGIAISGIAGPGGGMPGKPVGTVWLAICNSEKVFTKKLQLQRNRMQNIELTAMAALDMIRRFVLKNYSLKKTV